jgi:hypothetical protein
MTKALISLILAFFLALIPVLAYADPPPGKGNGKGSTSLNWKRLVTIEDATLQPTTDGQSVGVQSHDGWLYVGYGDWNANTGPVDAIRVSPSGSVEVIRKDVRTEAIDHWSLPSGQPVAPYTDPNNGNRGGWVNLDGTVTESENQVHTFGVEDYQGHRYSAGSSVTAGTIWRDNVTVYEHGDDGYTRYLWVKSLNGVLYAGNEDGTISKFDGAVWSDLSVTGFFGYTQIGNKMVTWEPVEYDGRLWLADRWFDGQQTGSLSAPGYPKFASVDNGKLYIGGLFGSLSVYDGSSLVVLSEPSFRGNKRPTVMTVMDGVAYSTEGSTIYRATL